MDRGRLVSISSMIMFTVIAAVCCCLGTYRSSLAFEKQLAAIQEPSAPEEQEALAPEAEDEEVSGASGLKDGEYTGTAQGYGGPVTMKLVVEDGKIKSLEVASAPGETPAYLAMAKRLIPSIMKRGSADVDGVSGATYSSNAIKKASAEAIKKAGGKGDVDLDKAGPKAKGKSGKGTKKAGYSKPSGGWKDGVYTGTAKGFGGPVTVRVTIKGGKIVKITAEGKSETASYWSRAQAVRSRIIKKQSPKVDAVSGATYSSNGIINAVINALNKAAKKKGPKSQTISSEDEYEVVCGETVSLKAKAKTKLSYSSSDTKVAAVSKDGKVTGISSGKVKISIKAAKSKKYKKATKKVTVNVVRKEQKITVEGYSAGSVIEFTTGDIGKTVSLSGTCSSGGSLSYSSDNEAAATVDGSGTVMVKGEGTAKIRISAPETSVYEAASLVITIRVTKDDEPPSGKINGTFEGTGRGYGGLVTAVVKIEESIITSIEVEGEGETSKYWFKAKKIVPKMVDGQTWDVDAVSGATLSSNGIRDAVKDALQKAGLI